jgi:hypothetical protein
VQHLVVFQTSHESTAGTHVLALERPGAKGFFCNDPMSKQLVPILADAIREYYDANELIELCGLFDTDLEWDHEHNKPSHLRLAQRLIVEVEHGNNGRLLAAILPSLFSRCRGMVAKTKWETKQYHEELERRLDKLRPLLDAKVAPAEIAVPDGRPFTAKSEIRELLEKADGPVLLVDAYVGVGTFDCLRPVKQSIRILTGKQPQSIASGFDAAAEDFASEGHQLEVRQHPKLHDRYLLFNDRCWLIGGSIKDAGIKALNLIECVDSKQAVRTDAERKWAEATIYQSFIGGAPQGSPQ